jgi:hypothetical protein
VPKRSNILIAICVALVAGAFLWLPLHDPEGEPVATARPSARYAPGHATTDLAAEGKREARENAAAAPPAGVDIENSGVLMVQVIAKETAQPVRSIRLILWAKSSQSNPPLNLVETASGRMYDELRPDEHGAVEIRAIPPRTELILTVHRDLGGTYPEDHRIPALAPDELRTLRLEIATQNDLVFVGRVVARVDHTPVARARIQASHVADQFDGRTNGFEISSANESNGDDIVSDRDGWFEVSVATWKSPYLRVWAAGFGLAIVIPNRGHETRESARSIELDRSARLSAQVVNASGSPIVEAHVVLDTPASVFDPSNKATVGDLSYLSLPNQRWEAASNLDGKCVFEELPASIPMQVQVVIGGTVAHRDPAPLTLNSGETRQVEWRIGAGCTLTGLLVDQDGQPVSEREIWLQKPWSDNCEYYHSGAPDEQTRSATTNANGQFEFRDVAAGEWCIGPAPIAGGPRVAPERAIATRSERIDVAESGTQEIVLHVYRGLYIRGTVVGPNGESVPHAWVSAGLEPQRFTLDAPALDHGAFVVGPLAPGKLALQGRGKPHAPSDVILAEAGADDLIIRLKPGGSLRGRIVDAETGLPCGGELVVTPETKRSGMLGTGFMRKIGQDGTFVADGLESGRYDLSAQTQDGRIGTLRSAVVVAQQTPDESVLRVSRGGTLRFRYDGKKASIQVTIRSQDAPVGFAEYVQAGTTCERLAPPGVLVLEVRNEPGSPPRLMTVDLPAGKERDVLIQDDE